MKLLIFFVFYSLIASAEDYQLLSGTSTYTVKHLIKRVQGSSRELKGKVSCPTAECEFLIAAPVKSFTSSDSNRDENMQTTIESLKFPLTVASGKVLKADFLKPGKSKLPIQVEFHGVKKTYQADFERLSSGEMKAYIVLKLTDHQVVRPSLFGVSIDDEVPVQFEMKWSEGI